MPILVLWLHIPSSTKIPQWSTHFWKVPEVSPFRAGLSYENEGGTSLGLSNEAVNRDTDLILDGTVTEFYYTTILKKQMRCCLSFTKKEKKSIKN